MKNILVTGGAGYIGSHTAVELLAAGYNPVILDDLSNSRQSSLDGIEKITGRQPTFYQQDYRDNEALKKVIKNESIDGIIHFAAFKAVGESVEQPLKYYQNNVAGLIDLLQTCQDLGVQNFVFSSSCTVYGDTDQQPLTENSPMQPAASPYGATKQMDEVILRDFTAAADFKSVLLRYFNPIGAHPSGLLGELPLGRPNCLVPFLTQSVAGLIPPLTVFGDDYPTPDGTCIRDYIHVVDLAKAHVAAIEFCAKMAARTSDVFNIGAGKGTSVLELIKTFEQATGEKVKYSIGPRRSGDITTAYADTSKAAKTLGWQARKSLADALADAWRWQRALNEG